MELILWFCVEDKFKGSCLTMCCQGLWEKQKKLWKLWWACVSHTGWFSASRRPGTCILCTSHHPISLSHCSQQRHWAPPWRQQSSSVISVRSLSPFIIVCLCLLQNKNKTVSLSWFDRPCKVFLRWVTWLRPVDCLHWSTACRFLQMLVGLSWVPPKQWCVSWAQVGVSGEKCLFFLIQFASVSWVSLST